MGTYGYGGGGGLNGAAGYGVQIQVLRAYDKHQLVVNRDIMRISEFARTKTGNRSETGAGTKTPEVLGWLLIENNDL